MTGKLCAALAGSELGIMGNEIHLPQLFQDILPLSIWDNRRDELGSTSLCLSKAIDTKTIRELGE